MRWPILALCSALLLAAGCSGNARSEGKDGQRVSRAFPVTNFSELVVAGPYEVTVAVGPAASVRAEGPQELIEATKVEVRDGRLTVRTGERSWNFRNEGPARISISVPALAKATLAGAGDMSIDRVTGERFEGTVAGAGDLTIGQVAVRELRLVIAGAGDVTARGEAQSADYVVAGTGDLDVRELTTRTAEASVAGTGNIDARVTERARASVAGVGSIDITGGARCEQRKAGIGSIRCS